MISRWLVKTILDFGSIAAAATNSGIVKTINKTYTIILSVSQLGKWNQQIADYKT